MATEMPTRERLQRWKRIAVIGGHFAVEKIHRARPDDLTAVPGRAQDITSTWLTAAMCGDVPGARVLAVEVEPVSDGSTTRARLRVTYNELGRSVGLPETAFIKSTESFQSRVVVGMSGGAEGESRFYSQIRPHSGILAPVGYHGATERDTGRTVLVLEDIARTMGAQFGDCTNRYVDRQMAETLVANLVEVHSCLWGSPRLKDDLRWLGSSLKVQQAVNRLLAFEDRCLTGLRRAGDVIPDTVTRRGNQIFPALMASLARDAGGPVGLVHTDVHSGNWFVTPGGRMGLYDWQALAKGLGYRDLAYALMSNLTIADRRAWEHDLVTLYVELFSKAVDTKVNAEDAWLAYRQQTFHGLCYWLFTLGASRLEPAMQKTSVSLVNLERMGQALDDLDSFAALNERGRAA